MTSLVLLPFEAEGDGQPVNWHAVQPSFVTRVREQDWIYRSHYGAEPTWERSTIYFLGTWDRPFVARMPSNAFLRMLKADWS